MVSSTEMQMGDESAKYVEISKFLKGVFDPWKTVMGVGKYDTVTGNYSGQYRYFQIARRKVIGPDGVVKPLIVEKAGGTVQRTILSEAFWKSEGEWGERVTFVDDDGEVTVRLKVVDKKSRKLEIYTKCTKESFHQETSCGLEQIIEDPANSLVEGAKEFVDAARKLGLPMYLCDFNQVVTGNITADGTVVYRHTKIIFGSIDNEYPSKEIVFHDKCVLPGSGENKGLGYVPPMKEGK